MLKGGPYINGNKERTSEIMKKSWLEHTIYMISMNKCELENFVLKFGKFLTVQPFLSVITSINS